MSESDTTTCKLENTPTTNNQQVGSSTTDVKETKSLKETSSSESVNLKRSREDVADKTNNQGDADDNEPEEKRPSFRLNPPTLIHGQAKSNPVQEAPKSAPKRNFLRPSKLAAPTSSTSTLTAVTTPSNGQISSSSENSGLGMLAGSVSSSNPFLLGSNSDNKDQERVFGSNTAEGLKENGEKSQDGNNETNDEQENTFLRPVDKNEKSEGGFVFGRNMSDRVVKSEADSSTEIPENNVEDSPAATEFVFGKNFAKRAKVANESSEASESSSSKTAASRKLEEDAAAMYAATNERTLIPEVEVITGEEDEKNVFQVPCKLYQLDNSSYTERGQGYLRLNDKKSQEDDGHFQSRLVMRTHGSLRLVLNVTIWAHMVIEKASQKSVRIQTLQDGICKVFLVMAAVNDAEQLYRAVEYRVLHLKQLEEKENAKTETSASSSQEVTSPKTETLNNNNNSSSPKTDTTNKTPSIVNKTDSTLDEASQSQ